MPAEYKGIESPLRDVILKMFPESALLLVRQRIQIQASAQGSSSENFVHFLREGGVGSWRPFSSFRAQRKVCTGNASVAKLMRVSAMQQTWISMGEIGDTDQNLAVGKCNIVLGPRSSRERADVTVMMKKEFPDDICHLK